MGASLSTSYDEAARAVSVFSTSLLLLYRVRSIVELEGLDHSIDTATRGLQKAMQQMASVLWPGAVLAVYPPTVALVRRTTVRKIIQRPIEDEESTWDPSSKMAQIDCKRCKRLLLEIMKRAAHDWVLYRTSRRRESKELANDAFVWLFQEEPGHPRWEIRNKNGTFITSFVAICEALDLDPDRVREYIRKLDVPSILNVGRPTEVRKKGSPNTSNREEVTQHEVTVEAAREVLDRCEGYTSYYESHYATITLSVG
jgi:hypothetical protein